MVARRPGRRPGAPLTWRIPSPPKWLHADAVAPDRRANIIELQPRAEAALEKAFAVSDRVQEAALAGFSAAERKQLVGMLQRVRANLQHGDAPESGDAS